MRSSVYEHTSTNPKCSSQWFSSSFSPKSWGYMGKSIFLNSENPTKSPMTQTYCGTYNEYQSRRGECMQLILFKYDIPPVLLAFIQLYIGQFKLLTDNIDSKTMIREDEISGTTAATMMPFSLEKLQNLSGYDVLGPVVCGLFLWTLRILTLTLKNRMTMNCCYLSSKNHFQSRNLNQNQTIQSPN